MQKNDVVRVAIEDMSHKGEGIGKADGYPLFIKDAVIGDELEVIVTKAGKSYGYGRIAKVWKPSPIGWNRAAPVPVPAADVSFRPWPIRASCSLRKIWSEII